MRRFSLKSFSFCLMLSKYTHLECCKQCKWFLNNAISPGFELGRFGRLRSGNIRMLLVSFLHVLSANTPQNH
ncbi:hypothetical protein FB446DRAFT_720020 [Lentinula raphanica]|nr:hypothetical protein FB446DRAFT_737201 [Lentinula raphanica]KAJ3776749.1 hypothetical protein FB446DRAFT_720020 [Lentinula raphanica]